LAYTITSKCISCHLCDFVCPTGAIKQVAGNYSIDPSLCNNCVGHHTVPQCVAACPTNNGCIPLNTSTDYWDTWFVTYNRLLSQLHQSEQPDYWFQWFDAYSQQLSKQLQERKLQTAGVAL